MALEVWLFFMQTLQKGYKSPLSKVSLIQEHHPFPTYGKVGSQVQLKTNENSKWLNAQHLMHLV